MTHPMTIGPAWREEPMPPECPRCGGKPDHRAATCGATPTPKDPMPIARDLSDLPPADPREGLTPDPTPRFVSVLADRWADESDDDKATALGTRFRHSDAGKCSRAIAYTAAGIPKSDPMDITGAWNTSLGTLIHEQWQEALQRRWPDAEVEVTCAMVGADGSGHIDAVIREYTRCADCDHKWIHHGEQCDVKGCRCTEPGDTPEDIDALDTGDVPIPMVFRQTRKTIAYELKTVGGFAFKGAVGAARKGTPAEGPKAAHLLQAAINGRAVDADEVIVGYLAKECISARVAKSYGLSDVGRFAAEWTLTREQYEPLADLEAERVAGILDLVADGKLAARKSPEMPVGAEVTDPETGAYEVRLRTEDGEVTVTDTGSTWECDYCSYQTLCATTEAGRIPIETVVSIGEVA